MNRDVDLLIQEYNKLSYGDKIKFTDRCQSPGFYESEKLDEKLGLITLIITLTLAFKKKNESTSCKDVLYKVAGDNVKTLGYDNIENLAVICEVYMQNVSKGDSCGLKSAKEVADAIRTIMSKWLPF